MCAFTMCRLNKGNFTQKQSRLKVNFKVIGLNISEDFIENINMIDYKALIKSKVRKGAFKSLEATKASHS